MRKVLSLMTVVLLAIGIASAAPVDVQTAKKVAENQYRNYAPTSIIDYSVKAVYSNENKGLTTFYTFTFNSGGFVIVSADDAVVPVLGYSHDSEMDVNNLNPNVKFWLGQYDSNISDIVSKKLSNTETRAQWDALLQNNFPKNAKAVAPIFNITWGQGSGYNTYCPPGTPVGCVATAMSMIMRYYEYPTSGSGWHKYNHPTYGEQSAYFFSTTYNYAAMPTNTGSTAAATLGYHLGVAVDMNYGPDGSGAQSTDVAPVMANYFKYDQGIQYVDKDNYETAAWIALLKNELDNTRPIYYSGSGSAGGHAFLCLGYNDNDQFYFNWGWDGSANGYFTMGSLNTGNGSFNQGNAAVINIKPAIEGEEEMLWVQKYSAFPATSTYPGYISAVSETVAWSIGRDGSGGGADYKVFSVTTDGGANWSSGQVSYGTAFAQVYGIDANTAYIAAYGTGTGNKIIKTTNRGLNWEPVLSGAGASSFFNVVHFFDENNGFVQGDPEGGYYELYTTTNAGADWTRVPSANIPAPQSSAEYGIVGHYTAVGDVIWYTTNNGYVYKSTDKGLNWAKYQIFSTTSTEVNAVIAFNDDATNGLILAMEGSGNYRKFKTTNGGSTWTEITSTTPDNFYNSDLSAVPGTNGMFVTVGADFENNLMGISYSTDLGETWTDYAQYYKGQQVVSVAMVSETKGYAGSFQGEYSGGMWVLGGTSNMAAEFSVNMTEACTNQDVTFTNGSFGQYTSIEWNFGEGATPATANTDGPHAVSYSTGGTKTISVTISDGNTNITETKSNLINIVTPPTADFTFIINAGFNRLVDFTSVSTGTVTGTSYVWDMGNGMTLTRNIPTLQYIYPSAGVYDVTLTVQNIEGGCSDAITKVVDNTVSITENTLSQMAIYPNPANSKLTIANVNGASVEIYSMDGRLAYQAQVNTDSFEINVQEFESGLYSVKVIKENDATTTIVAIQ